MSPTNAKTPVPPKDRHQTIYQMLRLRGKMTVAELQALLGVSDMTVRRSLNDMAASGMIRRFHGGAEYIDVDQNERLFQTRERENVEYKLAIAREAMQFLPPGGSAFLDGGTTCYQIAKCIPRDFSCYIVTDSIATAREVRSRPGVEAILLGGQIADDDNTIDGPLTAELAAKISVDVCMFSTSSFNVEGLENVVLTSVLTKKAMIEKAGRNVAVADASKFDKARFIRFCDWDRVDVFITDERLPEDALETIRGAGVEVRMVGL